MSDVLIHPLREPGDPIMPPTGILLVNPAEAAMAGPAAKAVKGTRHFLFNSTLHLLPGKQSASPVFLAGPAVGAPMAVMVLEKLIALGARRIVSLGWCGSLSPALAIGDLLLPVWARSEEGTSPHYPAAAPLSSDGGLRETVRQRLSDHGLTVSEGPVWTTDAPYRETREKVQNYRQDGILGVDMETSALFAVAAHREVSLASVLLASDALWREPWQPGFRARGFKQMSRRCFETVLHICQDLAPRTENP